MLFFISFACGLMVAFGRVVFIEEYFIVVCYFKIMNRFVFHGFLYPIMNLLLLVFAFNALF